ncbi:hypothetical protein [Methylocaldum szegediense]|uniref:DUF4398 domain-containing protein n=1 Tax=Methylocaldum szegediense TaxID=73780 RepID=A0ABM9HWM3_9GAMM|nr:hypothetical protein [Methylocaldum szegediense]CAI8735063.1 conserved exported protein of unknown function [Methylocaldum szegediense]
MTGRLTIKTILALILSLSSGVSFAGGRYADPPPNLLEVQKATQSALDAAKQGNKDAALDSAKLARKLAVASYKEKSTMPMQNSSSRLKAVIAELENGGQTTAAVNSLEEVVKLINEEVEYYKKEGKL